MDPVTAVTLLSLNLIGIGGLLVVIGRHMSDTGGLRGFGTGSLALGGGYLLRLALGFDSPGIGGVAADTCMVFATLCFATGFLQFSGDAAIGRRRLFTATLLYAAVAVAVTLMWHGVGRHAVLNTVLALAYGVLAGLALRASGRESARLRLPLRLLAGGLVIIGVATGARAVTVLEVGMGPLFAGPWAQAYYAYSVVFSCMLGPSLLWIVFVRLQARLNELATKDPLTGLLNRNGLEDSLRQSFGQRPVPSLVVMLLDVDLFKRINDRHGHAAGDGVLRAVAQSLKAQVRGADIVARWGGEEFMVCSQSEGAAAAALAERLRLAIAGLRLVLADGPALACTVSVGVSLPFSGREGWEPAVRAADAALYEAKRLGRDRVSVADAPPRLEQPRAGDDDLGDGFPAPATA